MCRMTPLRVPFCLTQHSRHVPEDSSPDSLLWPFL
uniref:Uncharacterized protein n=1 Tax=Anguilla anguilla TaxID=7936 RepID=A0A0E9XIQ7_ANGAN